MKKISIYLAICFLTFCKFTTSASAPIILVGEIGTGNNSTITIEIINQKVTGSLKYAKTGKTISLKGNVDDKIMTLQEFGSNGQLSGIFTGNFDKTSFTGNWSSPDFKKNVYFTFSVQDNAKNNKKNLNGKYKEHLEDDEDNVELDIAVINEQKFGFVITGHHGPHFVNIEGVAYFDKNGNGIYDEGTPDAYERCNLIFKFSKNTVEIEEIYCRAHHGANFEFLSAFHKVK